MLFSKRKTPVFILGCQRSGTTICQNVFLNSNRFAVFREGNKEAMTDSWRLRPTAEIKSLIERTKSKTLIFKPINDSHYADRFLDEYEGSKVIWIFRSFDDTANSAVAKWGASQRDMVQWIAENISGTDDLNAAVSRLSAKENYGIYAERISKSVRQRLIDWAQVPISEHTGAAILWYVRNHIFFDLKLDEEERVLPIAYERFAETPHSEIERICQFVGAGYSKKLSLGVRTSSIGRHRPPVIASNVREACEELSMKLKNAEMLARTGSQAIMQ